MAKKWVRFHPLTTPGAIVVRGYESSLLGQIPAKSTFGSYRLESKPILGGKYEHPVVIGCFTHPGELIREQLCGDFEIGILPSCSFFDSEL